jgi:AcrR family transcriptional regulator
MSAPARKTRLARALENDTLLLDAGRRLFLARGYHATSLDLISREAGLTKGAVYARFASKADLFFVLLESYVEERLAELEAVFTSVRGQPVDVVARRCAQQWGTRMAASGDWSLLVMEFRVAVARESQLVARYAAVHQRLRDGLAALLRPLTSRRSLSPEALATMLLASGNGLLVESASTGTSTASLFEELAVALASYEP